MTRTIDRYNRTKATSIPLAFGGGTLHVSRNHEGENGSIEERVSDILYISPSASSSFTMSLDAAIQLRDAINEVILDAEQIVENAKPKPLTAEELGSLPTGAEVHENERRYIKTDSGQFVKIDNGTGSPYFPVGTLYTIDELAGFAYIDEEN